MSELPLPNRRRIRLPADSYLEPGRVWLVTIGVAEREMVFVDHDLAHQVADLLRTRCAALGANLFAYCLMPDHLHLLLQVDERGLVDIVRDFKSRSTRLWWQHNGNGPLWQRSFYDRGIRTSRDFERAAAYVLSNPVRGGLVENGEDYPLLGGMALEA